MKVRSFSFKKHLAYSLCSLSVPHDANVFGNTELLNRCIFNVKLFPPRNQPQPHFHPKGLPRKHLDCLSLHCLPGCLNPAFLWAVDGNKVCVFLEISTQRCNLWESSAAGLDENCSRKERNGSTSGGSNPLNAIVQFKNKWVVIGYSFVLYSFILI